MPAKMTEAIILQVKPFQESDLIVHFFSADLGRLIGIAKGAKRSKRRFIHCLEPLSWVRLFFFEKENASLVRIDQGELIESFEGIGKDFRKWGQAGFFCEMIKELFPIRDPNREVFDLLTESLYRLNQKIGDPALKTIVELRLLKLAGYGLHLGSCLACQKKIEAIAEPFFSSERGGVLCPGCLKGKGTRISPGALQSLQQSLVKELSKVFRIRFTPAVKTEIENVLEAFSRQVLGKELESVRYLKQVQEGYG